jgi:hypothetical protein
LKRLAQALGQWRERIAHREDLPEILLDDAELEDLNQGEFPQLYGLRSLTALRELKDQFPGLADLRLRNIRRPTRAEFFGRAINIFTASDMDEFNEIEDHIPLLKEALKNDNLDDLVVDLEVIKGAEEWGD